MAGMGEKSQCGSSREAASDQQAAAALQTARQYGYSTPNIDISICSQVDNPVAGEAISVFDVDGTLQHIQEVSEPPSVDSSATHPF